jgi:hypothetical protein
MRGVSGGSDLKKADMDLIDALGDEGYELRS